MTKTIFQKSVEGRRCFLLPGNDCPPQEQDLPVQRTGSLGLPQVGEQGVVRHYMELASRNYHIDKGIYPLGSCTMKYNPVSNEEIAGLSGFTGLHPEQDSNDMQGALKLIYQLERDLGEICGMSAFTLQPAAGAHGELLGMMLARAYFRSRGEDQRENVIIPDSAHGTNPASVAHCGFKPVQISSNQAGIIDPGSLREKVDEKTAVLMLTLPNTLGLFEREIKKLVDIIHQAGALIYMDGANMNAMMGMVRPGEIGVDILHLNLHKTFSTPHGGGGPGAGPVGVRDHLKPFLPVPRVEKNGGRFELNEQAEKSVGRIHPFLGNFNVFVKAYAYIRRMGPEGLRKVSENAIINANYLMKMVKDRYDLDYPGPCMHEFVVSGSNLKKFGVNTLDVAKRILDYGMHAPTVYFPLIVKEALMIEPVETESRETLDEYAGTLKKIADEAESNPDLLLEAPVNTPVRRLDEAAAARNPDLSWPREGEE